MEQASYGSRIAPDMERIREAATPDLVKGFAANSEYSFAIVGLTGTVYGFGTEDDRAEAEVFCSPGHPREEPLYIFGRPNSREQERS